MGGRITGPSHSISVSYWAHEERAASSRSRTPNLQPEDADDRFDGWTWIQPAQDLRRGVAFARRRRKPLLRIMRNHQTCCGRDQLMELAKGEKRALGAQHRPVTAAPAGSEDPREPAYPDRTREGSRALARVEVVRECFQVSVGRMMMIQGWAPGGGRGGARAHTWEGTGLCATRRGPGAQRIADIVSLLDTLEPAERGKVVAILNTRRWFASLDPAAALRAGAGGQRHSGLARFEDWVRRALGSRALKVVLADQSATGASYLVQARLTDGHWVTLGYRRSFDQLRRAPCSGPGRHWRGRSSSWRWWRCAGDAPAVYHLRSR